MTDELETLKAERAELLRLASESNATIPALSHPPAERRAAINSQLQALAAAERDELGAWLDGGRSGPQPTLRDAERAKLFEELAAVRDDDAFAAETQRVAALRNEEFARRVAELTRRIEQLVNDRLAEHVEAAISENAKHLETVSKSLAKLGGLQRALFALAREHGRAGRRELENAVNASANVLSDHNVLQLTEDFKAADEARQEFENLVAKLRA